MKQHRRRGLALSAFAAAALLSLFGASAFGEPWEQPAFSSSPQALMAAAAALPIPANADVEVLLEEGRFSFDAEGRCTRVYRTVYRVLTAAGAEEWASIEALWSPWYQARPQLRARVVTAAAAAFELDPATIDDAPAEEMTADLYSDARVLRAPLPAVSPGAVVEQEISVRDERPFFAAGVTDSFYFGGFAPVRRARLVLEFPASLSLGWLSRLPGSPQPARTEKDGVVRLVFEAGPLAPLDFAETNLPADVSPWPYVAFSTGRSWAEVARAYDEIVERQIAKPAPATVAAPGAAREARIGTLLAKLHKEVRYTGVEFGDASIVPRTPAETLRRHYGDCKDKSALLVSMLRAEGISARLALLRAGTGEDVRPELPGLGGFNHAIVYVEGTPPVWIDPTDQFARAGQLPLVDQGRLALVVAPGASALVRTPESASTDNVLRETREIFLAEDGPARVVETSETSGAVEQELRSGYFQADRAKMRRYLEQYAQKAYGVEKIASLDFTDPLDLSRPFRIRIEASGATRATTAGGSAVVVVHPAGLLGRLPPLTAEDAGEEEDAGDDASASESPESDESPEADEGIEPEPQGTPGVAAAKLPGTAPGHTPVRRHDFVLDEPFVAEWEYRITPPPGFRARPLPESRRSALGPAVLERQFAVRADGLVTARLRFDTAKRRFTPAEVEELRHAVDELGDEPPVLLRFELAGEAHLQEGRVREALVEFRRLAALHPGEALHRSQTARALLVGGLGEAARAEVERAVELERRSAEAHRTRGWIMEHDPIGRRFSRGWDRPATEAAYRRAILLDPKDAAARGSLAILLEHDDYGVRYGEGARLSEAIAVYQALAEDLDVDFFEGNLFTALLLAQRFDELAAAADKSDNRQRRATFATAIAAVREGAPAAIAVAAREATSPAARREILAGAGQAMVQMRLYPLAADLHEEAAKGGESSAPSRARIALLRKLRRHETAGPAASPAAALVADLMRESIVAGQQGRAAGLEALFCGSPSAGSGARTNAGMSYLLLRSVRAGMGSVGIRELPAAIFLDFTTGLVQTTEGDDAGGYRLRLRFGASPSEHHIYVARRGERMCVVAGDDAPFALAGEALAYLARGDLAGARRWLGWAREEVSGASGEDPLAFVPFARLWEKNAQGDAAEIGLAAASLAVAAGGEETRQALAVLERARPTATAAQRIAIDVARLSGYRAAERWSDLAALAGELLAAHPDSDRALNELAAAMRYGGDSAPLEAAIAARLARDPDDIVARRCAVHLAQQRGDLAAASAGLLQMVENGTARASDFNSLAWLALFIEEEGSATAPATLDHALQSVEMSRASASLHTLATIYAERDQCQEAREILFESMALRGAEDPDSHDWYVLGRIAEQYGARESAIAAYRRVEPSTEAWEQPVATYRLAQKRLLVLKAASAR